MSVLEAAEGFFPLETLKFGLGTEGGNKLAEESRY